MRRRGLKVGDRGLVVGGVAIAVARAVPLQLGQLGLERDDARGRAFRFGLVAQARRASRCRCCTPCAWRRTSRRCAGSSRGRACPSPDCADLDGVLFGVALVGADAHREGQPDAKASGPGKRRRQLAAVADAGDRAQLVLQRRDAQRLEPRLVHEALVEVADLLAVRAGGRLRPRLGLDDGSHGLLAAIAEDAERAVTGPIGGDRRVVDPPAVHVAKEVVLGTDRQVHARDVDSGHDRNRRLCRGDSDSCDEGPKRQSIGEHVSWRQCYYRHGPSTPMRRWTRFRSSNSFFVISSASARTSTLPRTRRTCIPSAARLVRDAGRAAC